MATASDGCLQNCFRANGECARSENTNYRLAKIVCQDCVAGKIRSTDVETTYLIESILSRLAIMIISVSKGGGRCSKYCDYN